MKRDTLNDTELAKTTVALIDGTQGRIERLVFADTHQEGICFSWWENHRIMPRPLDGTDKEILLLFKNALRGNVFSAYFLAALREMLFADKQYRDAIPSRLRKTPYAIELDRVSIDLADGSEGRIERLQFKQNVYAGKEGVRFSWWRGNRMMPWPLSLTEEELLLLLRKALGSDVFSKRFLVALT
jgi:hypothetical protein